MVHDKEEQARIIRQASRQAIALALQGRWREAVEVNKDILTNFPADVDTLNRLGRAHMELGEYDEARTAYQRAKELDPYNSIADKNLRRLSNLDGDKAKEEAARLVEPRYFIEETGKAGALRLINVAPKETLAKVVAGDPVRLEISDGNLAVRSQEGVLLGWVEPRHGQRLARLMNGGNQYLASVISSSEEGIAIIIRETFQHPSQAGQLSFPSKGLENLRPYVSDKLIRRHLTEFEEGAEGEGFSLGEEEGEAEPEEAAEENEEEE